MSALAFALAAANTTVVSAAVEPGTPVAVEPGVPDQGRSWELVTSPDPESAFLFQVLAIPADGNRISYNTFGQLPDSLTGLPLASTAIAERGADGWVSSTQPPPLPEFGFEPYPVAIDPSFENSIWFNELSNEEPALFRRTPEGQYTEVVSDARFIGTSTDLQDFTFSSEKHLLAADASRTSGHSIYEVEGSTLRLVDVDDQGQLLSDCGSSSEGPNSISADGRRIFFVSSPGCSAPARVYLRANGTTTQISASQCDLPDCGPEANVAFLGATPDGSSAFLLTEQRLSDEDSDSHADLYRYDVAGGKLTLLSAGPVGGNLIPASAAIRICADGSHVYFAAREETGPGEMSEPRLYLLDAGGVRPVPGADPGKFVQVSASGRYALYETGAQLVKGDTDESVDVYRYDAEAGTVSEISIGPAGGNGAFDARTELFLANELIALYASTVANYPYRAMSEDGSRVFFETAERLVPEDHNDATDVYEWANGTPGLISSGAGELDSHYVIATPDGATVLFLTGETLLPRDRDGGDLDYYAARVGSGFAEAPPPGAACADPCQVPPRGRGERPSPASARPRAGGIRVAAITAAARRRIAASGRIELLAEVPAAGKLSVEGRARIGGRERIVASASVKVAEAGPARLRMRLSKRARQSLAQGHSLHVHLRLRLARHLGGVGFELGGSS